MLLTQIYKKIKYRKGLEEQLGNKHFFNIYLCQVRG